jgi:hypothetical protein
LLCEAEHKARIGVVHTTAWCFGDGVWVEVKLLTVFYEEHGNSFLFLLKILKYLNCKKN